MSFFGKEKKTKSQNDRDAILKNATKLMYVSQWQKTKPARGTIQFKTGDKVYETDVKETELIRHPVLGKQYKDRTFDNIELVGAIQI